MAILIHCSECKRYLSRKKVKANDSNCFKCGLSLARSRKFWVNVKLPDGDRVTEVVEGTLTFAKSIEAKIKTDISKRKHFKVGPAPLIDEIWKKYLKWAKKNKKSWYDDRNRWELHVEPVVKAKKMDAITRGHIRRILEKMEDKGRADATRKHVYALIRRVYNWAIEHDFYYGTVPTEKIKPPKVQNEVTECLSTPELDKLTVALDNWPNQLAALLVKFALYTGLRQDECMGLEWKDVDTERGFFRLLDPKGRPTSLPLSKISLDVVRQAEGIKPHPDCLWVFPNKKGGRRVSFFHIWSRIRKTAKIRKVFRFHDLRHTFATYLASSGEVDLYTLQKLLNHQTPAMTQRYAHLLDEALRRGANVADKVFNGNSKDHGEEQSS
jgi:integrase